MTVRLILSAEVLFSVLNSSVIALGILLYIINGADLALGQELLPEAGSNQTIGTPNTNITSNNDSSPNYPDVPGSLLDPFFGR